MDRILIGLVAGATGTTALDVVTSVDMLVRGRPASDMPCELAGEIVERLDVPIALAEATEKTKHREEALGALMDISNGMMLGRSLRG